MNLLETYNKYKDIINEAWSTMKTQDTEKDIEKELNNDLLISTSKQIEDILEKYINLVDKNNFSEDFWQPIISESRIYSYYNSSSLCKDVYLKLPLLEITEKDLIKYIKPTNRSERAKRIYQNKLKSNRNTIYFIFLKISKCMKSDEKLKPNQIDFKENIDSKKETFKITFDVGYAFEDRLNGTKYSEIYFDDFSTSPFFHISYSNLINKDVIQDSLNLFQTNKKEFLKILNKWSVLFLSNSFASVETLIETGITTNIWNDYYRPEIVLKYDLH